MAVDLSLPAESTGQMQRWLSATNPFAECPSQPAWVLYDTIVKSVLADSGALATALQVRSETANLAVGLERVLDAVRRTADAQAGSDDPAANSSRSEARAVLFAHALVSGETPEANDQNRRWLHHVLLPELESVGLSLMMVLPAGGDDQIRETLRQADDVQLLTLDAAGAWQQALNDWITSPTDTPAPIVVAGDPPAVPDPLPAPTEVAGDSVSMAWWLLLPVGLGAAGIGIWRWLAGRRTSATGISEGAGIASSAAFDEATKTVPVARARVRPAVHAELTSTEKLPPRHPSTVRPATPDNSLDTRTSGSTVSRYRPLHEGPGGGAEGDPSENLSAWDMPADRFEKDRS